VFRDQIGLPPKTVARVLRFQRAIRLYDGGGASWVDVAYACGYADEAHFIKDFRRFAGATPQAFLATRHPGEGAAALTTGLASTRSATWKGTCGASAPTIPMPAAEPRPSEGHSVRSSTAIRLVTSSRST